MGMSKHIEVLNLALEALEESLGYVQEEAENAQRLYGQYPTRQARIQGLKDDARKHMDAITAIREALAEQPAPPPECKTDAEKTAFAFGWWKALEENRKQPAQNYRGLRITLPENPNDPLIEQPAQQQEPVAKVDYKQRDGFRWLNSFGWQRIPDGSSLYTSPQPIKPWVGLTEDEIDELDRKTYGFSQPVAWRGPFARAVEAKLREKNA